METSIYAPTHTDQSSFRETLTSLHARLPFAVESLHALDDSFDDDGTWTTFSHVGKEWSLTHPDHPSNPFQGEQDEKR